MTVGMVPGASIAGMVFSLVVSFALPIGLFVYAKKKLGAKTAPFFIGCGVFFVMVLMLRPLSPDRVPAGRRSADRKRDPIRSLWRPDGSSFLKRPVVTSP